MALLRQMLGGNQRELIEIAVANGNRCTLPDGSRVTLPELAQRVQGMGATQAFREFGHDLDEVVRNLNS